MTAYLVENPPRVRQFRERGTTVSGVIVMHTAESLPDFNGPDLGAEGVARFIRDRSDYGSYHRLCDSDSVIELVPFDMQAYGDGTGSNPHAIHVSAATQAAKWHELPKAWVEATIENMAFASHQASDYVESVHGIRVPARRITRAQSDQRVEGFITHGERDPGRRTDPGKGYDWDLFFEAYRDFESPAVKPKGTRGKYIDLALRHQSAAVTALDKATGRGQRALEIQAADEATRRARRITRKVNRVEQ